MEGWISIHRKIQNNKIWTSETFSRGQAWVDLILLANHKDGFITNNGDKIMVKRGDVFRSIKGLSSRWKWSRTKVRRFLDSISTDGDEEPLVTVHNTDGNQIITIKKYDEFQRMDKEGKMESKKGKKLEGKKSNGHPLPLEPEKKGHPPLISGSTNDEIVTEVKTGSKKSNGHPLPLEPEKKGHPLPPKKVEKSGATSSESCNTYDYQGVVKKVKRGKKGKKHPFELEKSGHPPLIFQQPEDQGLGMGEKEVKFFDRTHTINNILNIKNKEICRKQVSTNLPNFEKQKPHEERQIMKTQEENSHEVIKSENKKIVPPKISEEAIRIYDEYPSRCFEKKSRTLKSRKTNLDKIQRILRSGEFTADRLIAIIRKYREGCEPSDNPRDFVPPLKAFKTFLNNVPDYSDKELGVIGGRVVIDEAVDDRYSFDCDITPDMLEDFEKLDRIWCRCYDEDGKFVKESFVSKNELLNKVHGFDYTFGAEKLTMDTLDLKC